MAIQLPILYSQKDTRWGNILLGFNTNSTYNLYNYGCLVTCWAMICQYYGKNINPAELNQKLKDLGNGVGFTGGGNYVPGAVNKIYSVIKENRIATPSLMVDTQMAEIKGNIDNGYPVIIGIDYNPQDVDYDSHFVVIVGYNASDENDFTIADPITGTLRSLKSYLGWYKPTARKTIESYVITSGPKPAYNADTIPVLKTDFENLVRKATNFDKMVQYLKPESDPNTTQYEDLQTVVAGIKSRVTDLENQLKQAILDRDLAVTELANQVDKLANVTAQCQRELEQKSIEYDALKSTVPNVEKLKAQYQGTISELEGQLREAQKTVGKRDLTITELKAEIAGLKKSTSILKRLLDRIKKLLQ